MQSLYEYLCPAKIALSKMNVNIEDSWRRLLKDEFEKVYFSHLADCVRREYLEQAPVYPAGKHIFRAMDLCPVEHVKVVILGQDPYHGEGQAEGLSFSVPPGVRVPPSLHEIKAEIARNLGRPSIIPDGHLMPWVEQGVLLLNSTLTVRAGQPNSHSGIGWETFTDAVIERLSAERSGIVFMLWGRYAQRKGAMIDRGKHCVLEAAHPSPLARGAFRGCEHFSQANDYLKAQGQSPIEW